MGEHAVLKNWFIPPTIYTETNKFDSLILMVLCYSMVTCHNYILFRLVCKFLWETGFASCSIFVKSLIDVHQIAWKRSLFWEILTSLTDACIICWWTAVCWSIFGFQMFFIFDIILWLTITWPFIVVTCAPQLSNHHIPCKMKLFTFWCLSTEVSADCNEWN